MFHYGLTGGIGSGKSTVAKMFCEAGIPVLDADQLAKKLLTPGSELAALAAERFPSCANDPRSVDRDKLARLVFHQPRARRQLEDLIHPAIWCEYLGLIGKLPGSGPAIGLLEAAVLLESRSRFPLVGIIVVIAPREIRIRRLRERADLDQEQVAARMSIQLPDHEKLTRANYVIENHASFDRTRQQVMSVLDGLLREIGEPNEKQAR